MLFLLHLAVFFLKTFIYLLLLFVSLLLFCRVWFEPKKGKCKCITQLHGKVALVTGGNSGIGLETARDLASRGARVIIACRDAKRSREAVEDIIRTTGNLNVEYRYLDLFKPSCIREFAANFNKTVDRLDIMVNNAGCAGPKKRLAENGVDIVMQVNHIGPFLLTRLLTDKIVASKPSRIIIVSSKLHLIAKLDANDIAGVKTEGHYTKYANSKLCNILWAKALSRRLPEGVTVNSLHPGVVRTDIFKRLGSFYTKLVDIVISILFKSSEEGAQTSIHLCVVPELENSSGGYYSDCKLQEYSRITRNEELTEKVWLESLQLSEQ